MPLAGSPRTTVWAELRVQPGSVRYYDLEGSEPRGERLDAGGTAIIVPGVEHLTTDASDRRTLEHDRRRVEVA